MDDGKSEEEQVMSEVHLGCPPLSSGPHISCFTISFPPNNDDPVEKDEAAQLQQSICLDADGDLVLTRRTKRSTYCLRVTIQHNITSSIPSVGLQVWRAELVLSDFILHKICTSSELNSITALEFGAGTGLVGLLVARVANTVFLTDRGDNILDNCAKNVDLNSGILRCQVAIHVRELDWKNPWPPEVSTWKSTSCERYVWTSSEIEEVQRASLLLAADVIYSDDLTDAFFSTLEKLMSLGSEKVLYLALEKRYNFSLDELDVVANGYSRFKSYLREERAGSSPCFVGKCVDLVEIPQYVREYDRGRDVELWEIRYVKEKS